MVRSLFPWLLALAAGPVFAAADLSEAAPRCESEVTKTLQRLHGRDFREARFDAARRQVALADTVDAAVRGEGRWVGSGGTSTFRYSCAYNTESGEASGVVLNETQPPRAAAAAAGASWDPDLTKVTPAACESAAAAQIKVKNPRVARIAFDADTRRLSPADSGRIGLEGQGALQRAPGMSAQPFGYRCEFDGRNGRVVAVSTRE
jgi:hypothetical protein